ncbi:apolipoprotein N-acyltransferase [Shinella curvata]|uniref:Apolipoprotein N-acyltransferase n=1 Tax=Shinella curvata TaxID=1817964 RepID=A0ABT8XC34_9HYPH|nr:apolipoprotein N-acyltransferase [Shinella curvata]MCJ8054282.1 apolipoprotein N-acyltransferase [Shinella curvata]MDO6121303.1 apolipoprotein N-acyltransferase [Shinella curvata]
MERLAGTVMLLSGTRRALVAFLAGLIGVLALPPFGFFAALFLSFTLLVWLLDGASAAPGAGFVRRLAPAFRIGWFFGFGYFVGGLWWLGNALLVEADDYAWALPLAILGLPAFLALYYGLAAAIARLLWSDGMGRIAALAFAFGVAEWLRGTLFTGFPWNAVGYGAMPVPLLMQSSGVLGIAAINALAVFVFAAPALIGTRRGRVAGLTVAILLFAAHVGYGYYALHIVPPPQNEATVVRLVQPVIDQAMKLDDSARAEIFERHLKLSAEKPADGGKRPDIVVWPETSIPFILTDNPDALVRIADVLENDQVLIAGAVRTESAGSGKAPRYYNSIYVIDGKGQIVAAADKVHLVPFGEYMPFEEVFESLGVAAVAAMPGGFSAAREHQLLEAAGKGFYPLICYEAIFPSEINASAEEAAALLNVTNDAWFGNTPGPYQHFLQARLRAVERGLPLIRAANNGISAVVDGRGAIVTGLSYDTPGFIDATLPGRFAGGDRVKRQNWSFLATLAVFFAVGGISRIGFRNRTN